MPKLLKRIVETAEPRAGEYFLWDNELPGFGLRIFPTGRRVYIVQYRTGSRRPRRLSLGAHGVLTPEQARTQAIGVLAAVRSGIDPSAERKATRSAITVDDLVMRFEEDHIAVRLKERTAASYKAMLHSDVLPSIGKMSITDVTRADIAKIHHEMRKTPYQANRCLCVLSKMFNLAEAWGLRPDNSNPCRHIKKYRERKRERFLSANEMRCLGDTLRMAEEAGLCSPYAVAAFRLLILTGARLGEIRDCKWEYVHLDRGIIRLPDSKTGPKIIHLGRTAIDLLLHLPRKENNPYLICSEHHPDEPIYDLQSAWQKIRKWAGIESVRIHDLRHTFASNAVTMGMSLPMIGKLLGHTQTQTTARYAHLALDPVLEAANKVTDEMRELLSLPKPSEEITIEGKAVHISSTDLPPLAEKLHLTETENMPRFMTSAQTAAYLNINPRLLEYWRWKKTGPRFVKVGNSVRYTREDLDAFIKPTVNSSPDNSHR